MKDSAYKQSGVDIEAADDLIKRIVPHVKNTDQPGVMSGLGGFGAFFDLAQSGSYQNPVLVSSTDGVGTKLKLAFHSSYHKTIGIDCVAMCVNDILVHGAKPLFFLDYFATGRLKPDQAEEVIAGIAKGCEMAGCALIGGETAEMPGMYSDGEYDLAGFTVGVVEKDKIIDGRTIKPGDQILALASDGLHSNGFSLVRRLVDEAGYEYSSPGEFTRGAPLAHSLLTPTRIYASTIMDILGAYQNEDSRPIRGMAHITGGGIGGNLERILPENCQAVIDCGSWQSAPVFEWLETIGELDKKDMLSTFNCGLGMIMVCQDTMADEIYHQLKSTEQVFRIGQVQTRKAADSPVQFENLEKLCRSS